MHELLSKPREHVSVFIVETRLDYRRCRSPGLPARLLPEELPVRRGLALLSYYATRAEVAKQAAEQIRLGRVLSWDPRR